MPHTLSGCTGCFGCKGVVKPRIREDEIKCKRFISAGDFNDVLKRYRGHLSANDVECLVAARDELQRHSLALWLDAEFYVQAQQHAFLFWTGKRRNKFICYRHNYGQDDVTGVEAAGTRTRNRAANDPDKEKIVIYCELGGKQMIY